MTDEVGTDAAGTEEAEAGQPHPGEPTAAAHEPAAAASVADAPAADDPDPDAPERDAALKDALIAQFRRYLDATDPLPPAPEGGSEADLYTLFVELAALRSEVRGESRLMKDALDQVRDVFQTLRASQLAQEQELARLRAREQDQTRALLRPLLLDLLDLRDRLVAGLPAPPEAPAGWLARLRRAGPPPPDPRAEGVRMTLRRLDQLLQDRRVTPIALLGRAFDPRVARVVATRPAPGIAAGIVLEDVRSGFLWEEQLLRLAEVIVSKPDSGASP